jgi:hypothetical protein
VARDGGGPFSGISYTLDAREAELVLEDTIRPKGKIWDLEMIAEKLFVCGPWGLSVLGWGPGFSRVGLERGFKASGLTAIEPCGGYLCAARLGPRGLRIFDVSDSQDIRIKGDTLTLGLGWDLAVWGNRAFVAHGFLGVGIYDISDPRAPAWKAQLFGFGGRVTTVAATRKILAAARKDGLISLYNLSETPQKLGEIQAKGRISRVTFRNGRLWVLGHRRRWVEVFETADPGNPAKVGEFSVGAAAHFRSRTNGPWAYTFQKRAVRGYRFQASVPTQP